MFSTAISSLLADAILVAFQTYSTGQLIFNMETL